MNKYVSPILEEIRNSPVEDALKQAHDYSLDYLKNLENMPVYPKPSDIDNLSVFDEDMPTAPASTKEILDLLGTYGSKATVAQTGGRYFGFVVGGNLPAVLSSRWLSDTWDQNSAMYVHSPIASKLESISEKWLVELLGFPEDTAVGLVTGSSLAIMCGLAAGRNKLLSNLGWDVAADGLFGAPQLKVVVSEEAHSTDMKMLSVLGLGQNTVTKIPTDYNGAMRMDLLPELDNRTLLILQAGNLHSGAFDDFTVACMKAKKAGAWVHVDGAIGLWAAANDNMNHLTDGLALADSWNTDGHKTLNTAYDIGIVFCKDRKALVNAMHMTGDYIILSDDRDNMMYTPEMSRRARGIDIWAVLKSLGKNGVNQLVEELHQKAAYFSEELSKNGFEILNEVVFNQISLVWKNNKSTEALAKKLQSSGVMWLGGSKWKGRNIIRISVSGYKTTYNDIDLCVKEFIRCAK